MDSNTKEEKVQDEIQEAEKTENCTKSLRTCSKIIQPVQDALYVLSGKWKLPIIITLMFGNKRFSEIAKEIPKITDRMLSKELRELEMNQLVKRTVYDAVPVVVEYSLTEYGETLNPAIDALYHWGATHRKKMFNKEET